MRRSRGEAVPAGWADSFFDSQEFTIGYAPFSDS